MGRFTKSMIGAGALLLGAVMIVSPEKCMESARTAVELCLQVVIPSLFPFFVCSSILIALGAAQILSHRLSPIMRPLFGVPGGGALAVVLGVISGYPVGAKCAADLYRMGACSKEEAERLTAFCNNSGPLFLMGAVGVGILGSHSLGVLIYVIHVLSALLVGFLFGRKKKRSPAAQYALPAGEQKIQSIKATAAVVADAVESSVFSILKVCGFVIVFAVLTAVFAGRPGFSALHALLEITGGIRSLAGEALPLNLKVSFISFFAAVSGVSVLLQVAGILSPLGLSVKPYLFGKFLQGIFAFVLTYLALRYLPLPLQSFLLEGPAYVPTLPTAGQLLAEAMISIGWCALAVLILYVVGWIYDRYFK